MKQSMEIKNKKCLIIKNLNCFLKIFSNKKKFIFNNKINPDIIIKKKNHLNSSI